MPNHNYYNGKPLSENTREELIAIIHAQEDEGWKPMNIPTYVDRERLAAEFMISTSTLDTWLADGTLPPPDIRIGRVLRWRWSAVEARFAKPATPVEESDPYLPGGGRGADQKGVRRAHS